jgi:hypothetical protein
MVILYIVEVVTVTLNYSRCPRKQSMVDFRNKTQKKI